MVARDDSIRQPTSSFSGWAEALLSAPLAALSEIVSGRGARGGQQLAEPDDFLCDLLAQRSLHDRRRALIEAIDGGLIQWMEERVDWSPARIDEFGMRAYVAQFSNVLAVTARLPLSAAPRHLMDDVARWDDRFRSMRWPGDIDLLRQFNLALAQHQPDERFAPRWSEACDEAAWAGPYWRSGLSTGLVGLRKIPEAPAAQPELRVATALARFAASSAQRATDSFELRTAFRRHALALTELYPRHDAHWQGVWAKALATLRGFGRHRHVVRDEWLGSALPAQMCPEPDESGTSVGGANGPIRHPFGLPDRDRLIRMVRLVRDASPPLDAGLRRRIRDLIRAHWDYAWASGDTHFAVRTTHNLCDRLLGKQPSSADLSEIHNWTLQAIRVETGNAHSWDLWAKTLSALGATEASLDVRWEAVRRFPNNTVVRSALADELMDCGRTVLAERLLRETTEDFPNDVVSRGLLGKNLLQQRRLDETKAVVSEIMELDPDNSYAVSLVEAMSDEPQSMVESSRQVQDTRREWNLNPQVSPYVASLAARTPLLERYFAPSPNGGHGAAVGSGGSKLDGVTSEFELVIACRAGRANQQDDNGLLDSWARVRPASYSTRLLMLSRTVEAGDLAHEEFSRIETDFPQHRSWNEWLGYAFVPSPRRSELRRTARKQAFWGGRLTAVYPGLDVPYRRTVSYEPAPLRRLFEDVALASTEVGFPDVPIE